MDKAVVTRPRSELFDIDTEAGPYVRELEEAFAENPSHEVLDAFEAKLPKSKAVARIVKRGIQEKRLLLRSQGKKRPA